MRARERESYFQNVVFSSIKNLVEILWLVAVVVVAVLVVVVLVVAAAVVVVAVAVLQHSLDVRTTVPSC